MGRGDVQHLGILQGGRDHTPVIHLCGHAADTAYGINFPYFAVTRLFHRIGLVPAQKLDQQIIKEVRSRAHQNMFRVHAHTPEGRQMVGNGLAQLPDTPVGQGQQQLFSQVQHHLSLQARPHREGKPLRTASGEVDILRGRCLLPGLDRGRGLAQSIHSFHEIANLFHRADIAFRQKLLVSSLHGDLAHLQIGA